MRILSPQLRSLPQAFSPSHSSFKGDADLPSPSPVSRRKDLERQKEELDDLSAKLARADEVERLLRAKLGEVA